MGCGAIPWGSGGCAGEGSVRREGAKDGIGGSTGWGNSDPVEGGVVVARLGSVCDAAAPRLADRLESCCFPLGLWEGSEMRGRRHGAL